MSVLKTKFVRVEAVSTTRIVIYVRPTGSDTTGDGSLGNPYRTRQRAVNAVPQIAARGVRYVIDSTGVTDADTVTVAGLQSPERTTTFSNPDFTPFTVEAYLTFQAVPTVVYTISSPTVTSESVPGFPKIIDGSSPGWDVDQWRGYLARRAGAGTIGIIVTNDTNTITIAGTTTGWSGGDVEILSPGASMSGLIVQNCSAPVRVNGMMLSVQQFNSASVQLFCCHYSATSSTFVGDEFSLSTCYVTGAPTLPTGISSRNVFFAIPFGAGSGGAMSAQVYRRYISCAFVSCSFTVSAESSTAIVAEPQKSTTYTNCMWIERGLVAHNEHVRLRACLFRDIGLSQPNFPYDAALYVRHAFVEFFSNVVSDGASLPFYGLVVDNGGRCFIPSTGAVPIGLVGSAADMKVGFLPGRTWISFQDVWNSQCEYDLFGDGSMIIAEGAVSHGIPTYAESGGVNMRPTLGFLAGNLIRNRQDGDALETWVGAEYVKADGLHSFHDEVMVDSPYWFWPLDDQNGFGSATLRDASGNGRTATVVLQVAPGAPPISRRTAKRSMAAPTGNYGEIGSNVEFPFSSSGYTIEFDFHTGLTSQSIQLVITDWIQFVFSLGEDGSIVGWNGLIESTRGVIQPNSRYHIAITYNGGSSCTTRVNGVAYETNDLVSGSGTPAFLLMDIYTPVANFVVYNSILSEARLLEHYVVFGVVDTGSPLLDAVRTVVRSGSAVGVNPLTLDAFAPLLNQVVTLETTVNALRTVSGAAASWKFRYTVKYPGALGVLSLVGSVETIHSKQDTEATTNNWTPVIVIIGSNIFVQFTQTNAAHTVNVYALTEAVVQKV